MEIQPVNLTELFGISLGMLTVLIPLLALALRFSVKPLVETLIHAGVLKAAAPQADGAAPKELARLERRVLELEQEVAKLKGPRRPELVAVDLGVGSQVEQTPVLERVERVR
jgi:hypothetical protein